MYVVNTCQENGQPGDTDNIRHTRHRTECMQLIHVKRKRLSRMDNQETMTSIGKQDTGRTADKREEKQKGQSLKDSVQTRLQGFTVIL